MGPRSALYERNENWEALFGHGRAGLDICGCQRRAPGTLTGGPTLRSDSPSSAPTTASGRNRQDLLQFLHDFWDSPEHPAPSSPSAGVALSIPPADARSTASAAREPAAREPAAPGRPQPGWPEPERAEPGQARSSAGTHPRWKPPAATERVEQEGFRPLAMVPLPGTLALGRPLGRPKQHDPCHPAWADLASAITATAPSQALTVSPELPPGAAAKVRPGLGRGKPALLGVVMGGMCAVVGLGVLTFAPGVVNPRPVVNAPPTIVLQGMPRTAAAHHFRP